MMSDELGEAIQKRLGTEADPTLRTFGAAVSILKYHLGEGFIASKIRLSTEPDPFLLNEFDEESDNRLLHVQRVCALASYVHELTRSQGFNTILERLSRRRSIEPAFADAEIANLLHRAGFEVMIRAEIGQRGRDFDMTAAKPDTPILNIEVTSSTAVSYRRGTLLNILRGKRSQVPKGEPAGLYILFPLTWFEGQDNLQAELEAATREFFRSSSRFNFVTYVWHPFKKRDDAFIHATLTYPVVHGRPGAKYGDLAFLTAEAKNALTVRDAVTKGAEVQVTPKPEQNFSYTDEYNDWVAATART